MQKQRSSNQHLILVLCKIIYNLKVYLYFAPRAENVVLPALDRAKSSIRIDDMKHQSAAITYLLLQDNNYKEVTK